MFGSEVSAHFLGSICLIYCASTLTAAWPRRSSDLGHREIGSVVDGQHTITLFCRPRTVHLEACSIAPFSSRPTVCGRRLRLIAQLSSGDGRPMERVGQTTELAVHDRRFRSPVRKIGHQHAAIDATGHADRPSVTSDRTHRTPSMRPSIVYYIIILPRPCTSSVYEFGAAKLEMWVIIFCRRHLATYCTCVQRTRTRLDDKSFSAAGPRFWNSPQTEWQY